MKANVEQVIGRLKTLYAKQAEDQIFAKIGVLLPPDVKAHLERGAAQIQSGQLTPVDQLFPFWEQCLACADRVEDDWLPAIYPHQYDQGLYGSLFEAAVEFNPGEPPGCGSSMTRPLEGTTYADLVRMAAAPNDAWLLKMEDDLRSLSARSRGRWGVGVAITIDGLNLCEQLRGNQAFMDVYDTPDEMKRFLQAAVALNIRVVERQRAAIAMPYGGGVFDAFNAGWMPGNAVPMSVDCYNLCSPEVYAEFGRPYQQQLIDHFGGGNFHLHGNGRHLLGELAQLKGRVVTFLVDDGSTVAAIDDIEALKRQSGSLTPVVACSPDKLVEKLKDHSLAGGVYYLVSSVGAVDEANRLMEKVRAYRV